MKPNFSEKVGVLEKFSQIQKFSENMGKSEIGGNASLPQGDGRPGPHYSIYHDQWKNDMNK